MVCSVREVELELPLLSVTPVAWARLAVARLDEFLADHAVCEQQAALTALNLVAHYPDDDALVTRMTALAAEEVSHLRRVSAILHRRGRHLMRRRPNGYTHALHRRIAKEVEPRRKIDRLIVGALIEARSCERFTRLLETLPADETEVASLLTEVGPAERRHWRMFFQLAAREADPAWFDTHWQGWLETEREIVGERGTSPAVHG